MTTPYATPEEELRAELEDELGDTADWTRRRLPATLSRREVRRLLAHPATPRNRLILRLLYATGMRSGELATLRIADVDASRLLLFLRNGKTGDRYACVDRRTMRQLQAFCAGRPPEEEVFGLTAQTFTRVLEEAAVATGLRARYDAMDRRISLHVLRHAFATHCYEAGMDLFTLQLLMGHVFLQTTRVYVHIGLRRAARAYRDSHPLAKVERHKEPEAPGEAEEAEEPEAPG